MRTVFTANKLLRQSFRATVILLSTACGNPTADGSSKGDVYFTGERAVELQRAISREELSAIDGAVARGADVNAVGRDGITPLTFAMSEGRKRSFQKLLELGANPNVVYSQADSAVHLAAVASDPDWLTLVMRHGGNPNLSDSRGYTPLFGAVAAKQPENLRILISAGADLDYRDSHGNSAILRASSINRYDLVFILLEKGADYRVRDNWGRTLADDVRTSRIASPSDLSEWRDRVAKWLEQKGIKVY